MCLQISRRRVGRGLTAPPQFLRHRGDTPLGIRLRARPAAHAHSSSFRPRAGFPLASRAWAEALGGRCEGLFARALTPGRSGVIYLGGGGCRPPT